MKRILRLLLLGPIFLPFVVRAGEPQPFSVSVSVHSTAYQTWVAEPYTEVAVRSAGAGSPLFQGFSDNDGSLYLGLFTDLPQTFYVEVKRDRVDGVLQHTLPLVTCNSVQIAARGELFCSAEYNYDAGTRSCNCYSW